MTQSPSLPELPSLPEPEIGQTESGLAIYNAFQVAAHATTHGLACYEAGSAAAAQAVPGWIGVEDRLPDERASAYLVAVIAKKTYSEGSNYPGMGIRSVVQDWVVRNYASSYTHWMALPETTPAAPTQGAEGAAPQAAEAFNAAQVRKIYAGTMDQSGSALTPSPTPTAPQEAAGATGKQALQVAQEADALREALLSIAQRVALATDECDDKAEGTHYIDKHGVIRCKGSFLALVAAARAALAQHQPQQGEQL